MTPSNVHLIQVSSKRRNLGDNQVPARRVNRVRYGNQPSGEVGDVRGGREGGVRDVQPLVGPVEVVFGDDDADRGHGFSQDPADRLEGDAASQIHAVWVLPSEADCDRGGGLQWKSRVMHDRQFSRLENQPTYDLHKEISRRTTIRRTVASSALADGSRSQTYNQIIELMQGSCIV